MAAQRGASVTVDRLRRSFGDMVAVDDVSIDIAEGEFLALLGPSGSGKTTVLLTIAGFDHPTTGRILIGGDDYSHTPANKRNLGMVFQKYTLFPHMSVLDNVAFPLKMRGVARAERHARAEEALATVRLAGYGARKPAQLSGGQQQRVALARAIVYHPRVLLMDEPLSALDKNLREEMQLEIKRLHSELGITMVFVTHDQAEALTMADRIAVLDHGHLKQIGTPRELYERPANLFTAGFIGEMNFLACRVLARGGGTVRVEIEPGVEVTLAEADAVDPVRDGDRAVLAVRPERAILTDATAPGAVAARVRDVVYAGSSLTVICRRPDGRELRVRHAAGFEHSVPARDTIIGVGLPPAACLLFAEARP